MAQFALTDEQKKLLFTHLEQGFDPRDSFAELRLEGVSYGAFLLEYSGFVVEYLRAAGSAVKRGQDADDAEAADERREIRRGLKEAFSEVLADYAELTEDQARRYGALCKLASAHAAMCKDKRGEDKAAIDAAAAHHSLLASNAQRERD